MSDAKEERVYGWKAIADVLGVSETQAKRLADPMRKFQLPVRYGARGIYAKRAQLLMWDEHYDAPFGLHKEMRRGPAQSQQK